MSRLEEERAAAKRELEQRDREQQQHATILDGPKPSAVKPKAVYQAFSAPTGDPQMRLIIYAQELFMMPRYDVLYDVFFDGLYDWVGLVFPHHRVRIYGSHLEDLIVGLRTNAVEWVREYLPAHHAAPDDPGAPVITRIDVDQVNNPFSSDRKQKAQEKAQA